MNAVNDKKIEKTLGKEATRNLIINEILNVLDQQGLNVDKRHILLLADAMCASGTIQSIGRHDVSGEKTSVFAKAAFEETDNHLLNASFYGQEDNLRGPVENIIIGQVCPVGTGKSKIIFDYDFNLESLKKM